MERLRNIIEDLRKLLLERGEDIKANLEFQIDISGKHGNHISVSTPSSIMPCLEKKDEDFEPCSLINFLNNELKEEFEEGKIGKILEAVKKHSQRNASENQSTIELDDLQKGLKETEEEAAALCEMQSKVEQEMGAVQDTNADGSSALD